MSVCAVTHLLLHDTEFSKSSLGAAPIVKRSNPQCNICNGRASKLAAKKWLGIELMVCFLGYSAIRQGLVMN